MKTADEPPGSPQRELFLEALEKRSPAERTAFLDGACGDNQTLRRSIEQLLAHHHDDSFLEESPVGLESTNLGPAPTESPLEENPEVREVRIGRYKLLQKIGEGGCGVVYMAEQEAPVRRRVALKVIKRGMDTKSVIARFEAERQALAMMDHPNIARVFDGGTTDAGRPYFVMELVRGIKITEYCDETKLSTRERLDLFIKVCGAIQHAHQKGIIHRDIKPSNILVTINDGSPVPKVIDFGIAKATEGRLTDKTLFTKFEMFIGTPAYVSPEQAVMTSLDVDTRSDIYSLGVVLYELLIGSTPFDPTELMASGVDVMRKTILEREPLRPSNRFAAFQGEELTTAATRRSTDSFKLKRELTGDLDWIVMKCLEKDRARRYETAIGLAADIQRHLDNETVQASPPSATYRVQKLIRRNKLGFAAVISVIAALLLGTVTSAILAVRARNAKAGEIAQRRLAEAQRTIAETNEFVAIEQRKLADMQLALEAWEEGDFERAEDLIAASRPAPDQPPSFEWGYLRNLCRDQSIQTIGTNNQYHVSRFLDRDSLLLCDGISVFIHDIPRQERRLLLEDVDGIAKLDLCAENTNLLVTVTDRGKFKIWDIAARRVVFEFAEQPSTPIDSITFSRDGKWLASANINHSIKIWNVATRNPNPVQIAHHYDSWVSDMVFSRDGAQLFTGGSETMIRIWDVLTGLEQDSPLEGHTSWVYGLALTQDGRRLASSGPDQSVMLWDLVSRKGENKMFGHMAAVRTVAFSPDQKILASGARDHTIRLWNAATGQLISLLRGLKDVVIRLEFSPDGKLLLSQSRTDSVVKLWRVGSGPADNTLYAGACDLNAVTISSDGLHVAASESADFGVYIWDLSTGGKTRLDGQTSWVVHSAFSPDGKTLACASHDGTVRLWDVSQHKAIATLTNGFPVGSLAFLPDGQTLIAGGSPIHFIAGRRGGLQFWDIPSQQRVATISEDVSTIVIVSISPNGALMATGHKDGTTTLWDVQTRQRLHQFKDQSVGSVTSLVFSPTEPLLAAGDWGGNIILYNTIRLETVRPRAKAHTARVTSLAFTPDGRTLASGGEGGGVKLWHTATLQVALSLKSSSSSVSFAPNGNFLASCGLNGTVRLWPAVAFANTNAVEQARQGK